MIIIGLTGGIASGKSTVSQELDRLGIAIHDADLVSRKVVAKGSEGLKQIIETFGEEYLTDEGELNRPLMAQLVFNNPEARQKLNNIVHTAVRKDRAEFLASHKDDKVVVLDVPLLIENGLHNAVDKVWLVMVSEDEQVRRAMLRDNSTEEQVRARIKAQMPFQEKAKYADLIIDNSGSMETTIEFVRKELEKIMGE